jgi:quinol monooxygenase YgiN
MAEHAAVIRIARYRPAEGKRDELLKRLQDGTHQIREMEGCFGAQICSSNQSPDSLVAVSRWASQAAVDRFLSETSTQRSELAPLISGAPATEHLTSL